MIKTRWFEFTWELARLPEAAPELPARLAIHSANANNVEALGVVYRRALQLDPGWGHDLNSWITYAEHLMNKHIASGEMELIAVKDGTRIIAVSGILPKAEPGYHLLPGVAVLHEYGSRSIGSYLLHESLRRLREKGVENAKAIAKRGIAAERYLYRKFHGTSTDVTTDFAPLLARTVRRA